MSKKAYPVVAGLVGVLLVVFFIVTLLLGSGDDGGAVIGNDGKMSQEAAEKKLSDMAEAVKPTELPLVKGTLSVGSTSLYDELPSIEKYPLAVKGKGDIDVEVFSSDEKAGKDTESWLIDVATSFNKECFEINGRKISVSVRDVSSGLGADYIISGKYVPEMYTPSNSLLKSYVEANGGRLEELTPRLVGNTAGVLVKKGTYSSISDVIEAVKDGKLRFGYTNPQVSPTGQNFMFEVLNLGDSSNMFSDTAVEYFRSFQANVGYIAETTIQMKNSMQGGTLGGMVMEYQSYISSAELSGGYDFIPFGIRHDNPLYITEDVSGDKRTACEEFCKYCLTEESQALATKKGFNANDDYSKELTISGSDISKALELYKRNKDVDKSVIAVFVADRSGSMDEDGAMASLKKSLSNAIKYINETSLIGLVSYAYDTTIDLPIAPFTMEQKEYFQGAVDRMDAIGGTASYDACIVAMKMIQDAKKDNPNSKAVVILLSDGNRNQGYTLDKIKPIVEAMKIPVYTIAYGEEADINQLEDLAGINEAVNIVADSDNIMYKLKSLFNYQT